MIDAYCTARTWHSLGVSTVPILRGSKKPAISAWKPYQTRLPTLSELELWFDGTRYGIAVITGRGLVIVDFDNEQQHQEWVNSTRIEATQTYHVLTARGHHYYYWCRDECEPGKDKKRDADVKAAHGYCLCPPSVHPSGVQYTAQGTPDDIVHIDSIFDVLPGYKPELPQPQIASTPRDIYDEAMRERTSSGVSIEDIKERISIEDVLGIPRVRRMEHINCPLPGHNDKHASFVIFGDGHGHCFGCGFHGDVVTLFSLLYNMPLGDTLRELARKVGLQ